MSFNFIPPALDNGVNVEKLPVISELARDLDTLELLTKNGKFYKVYKNEAIKIWVLKALNKETSRYTHRAYSSDYGNEIARLFGRNLNDILLKSELKRCVEEALLVNPYIKRVENFSFEKKGSKVNLSFIVSTVYGEYNQSISYDKE